ncbi:MAG: cupin domain-containing protein [Anaerolineae bacterium]|nr:cupin domain-containing protein [Anaerolineae bacterium]
MTETKPTCVLIRPQSTYVGKQGHTYLEGISAQNAGSKAICMLSLTLQPGERGKAHKHENHETTIYVISGEAHCWYGDQMEEHLIIRAGEFLYIPANVPHLPANLHESEPCVAILARTDPNEQESVVLLPELDKVVALP